MPHTSALVVVYFHERFFSDPLWSPPSSANFSPERVAQVIRCSWSLVLSQFFSGYSIAPKEIRWHSLVTDDHSVTSNFFCSVRRHVRWYVASAILRATSKFGAFFRGHLFSRFDWDAVVTIPWKCALSDHVLDSWLIGVCALPGGVAVSARRAENESRTGSSRGNRRREYLVRQRTDDLYYRFALWLPGWTPNVSAVFCDWDGEGEGPRAVWTYRGAPRTGSVPSFGLSLVMCGGVVPCSLLERFIWSLYS